MNLQRFSIALCTLALVVGTNVHIASLQIGNDEWQSESIELSNGNIFEITAAHTLQNADYSWILTKDGNFLHAERGPLFRTRLLEPGTYELEAMIRQAEPEVIYRRVFALSYTGETNVVDTEPEDEAIHAAAGKEPDEKTQEEQEEEKPKKKKNKKKNKQTKEASDLAAQLVQVTSSPQQPEIIPLNGKPEFDSNGRTVLTDAIRVQQLFPWPVHTYSIDLYAAVDSNEDGNAENDNDIEGSFFANGEAPLFVWVPDIEEPIQLSVIARSGATQVPFSLTYSNEEDYEEVIEEQEKEEARRNGPQITADAGNNEFIKFSVTALKEENPLLLFHWFFGDGLQSILDTPTHRYKTPGTYTVQVDIQNVASGEELYSLTKEINTADFYSAATDASNNDNAGDTSNNNGNEDENNGDTNQETGSENSNDNNEDKSANEDQSDSPETQNTTGEKGDTDADSNSDSNTESGPGILSLVMSALTSGLAIIIYIIIGVLLLLLFIGWLIWKLTSRARGNVVQSTIEKMEQKIVETDTTTNTTEVVDTAAIDANTEAQQAEVVTTTEDNGDQIGFMDTSQASTPPPSVEEQQRASLQELQQQQEQTPVEEAPSWLQQGMNEASTTGQTIDSPPPATLQEETPAPAATEQVVETVVETPAVQSTPAATPVQEAPAAEEASQSTDTPSWLQQPTAVEQNTAESAPAEPAPTPPQVQAGAPADSDQSSGADVPSWLQQPTDVSQVPTVGAVQPVEQQPAPVEPAAVEKLSTEKAPSEGDVPSWLQQPAVAQQATTEVVTTSAPQEPAVETQATIQSDISTGSTAQPISQPDAAPLAEPAPEPPAQAVVEPAPTVEPAEQPAADSVPSWLQQNPVAPVSVQNNNEPASTEVETSPQNTPAEPVPSPVSEVPSGNGGGQQTFGDDSSATSQGGDGSTVVAAVPPVSATTEPAPTEPKAVEQSNLPAWLQDSPQQATPVPTPAPSEAESIAPPAPVDPFVQSNPAPTPSLSTEPTSTAEEVPAPSEAENIAPPTPAAVPTPVPVPAEVPPAPAAQPPASEPVAPTSSRKKDNIPSWLQDSIEQDESPSLTPAPTQNQTTDLPDWLQSDPAPAPSEADNIAPPSSATQTPTVQTPEEPIAFVQAEGQPPVEPTNPTV